jgi:hypothetical protein
MVNNVFITVLYTPASSSSQSKEHGPIAMLLVSNQKNPNETNPTKKGYNNLIKMNGNEIYEMYNRWHETSKEVMLDKMKVGIYLCGVQSEGGKKDERIDKERCRRKW